MEDSLFFYKGFEMSYRGYVDADIIRFSKEVYSMAGLLEKLGLKPAGGNYYTMKKKLKELNLTCEHWTGQAWNKDKQLKKWEDYNKSSSVKTNLVKSRSNTCEKCGIVEWLGKPIVLELHHIDGDRTHNKEINLQLLCPNCHSVTDNWRGRNVNKQPIKEHKSICIDCGCECYRKALRCRSCFDKLDKDFSKVCKLKSLEEFKLDCKEAESKISLAIKYGVSRKTINAWIKKYNIDWV